MSEHMQVPSFWQKNIFGICQKDFFVFIFKVLIGQAICLPNFNRAYEYLLFLCRAETFVQCQSTWWNCLPFDRKLFWVFFSPESTLLFICVCMCVSKQHQCQIFPSVIKSNVFICVCLSVLSAFQKPQLVSRRRWVSVIHYQSTHKHRRVWQLKLTEHDGFTTSTFRSECIIFFILKQQRISCSLPQNLSVSVHTHTQSHTHAVTHKHKLRKKIPECIKSWFFIIKLCVLLMW